ncbi:MAG: hypothetical protein IAE78_03930 [Myxococcus sp.]|nr:hypothetical protein [Myxococcus sp.]
MRNTTFLFSASLLLVAGVALSQPGGPRRGPPPEALAACTGLVEGAACGFTHDGRNMTGACRAGPAAQALACRPEGKPGGHHHGPPPAESFAACQGQAEGAACSFSVESKNVAGTCRSGREGAPLACRPEGKPGGHHHGPPPAESLAACQGQAEGAACSFSVESKNMAGTCRSGREGAPLACRPEGKPGGRHHGPPPAESLAACQGQAEGAACSFSVESKNVTGTCRAGPEGAPLACRPQQQRDGRHGNKGLRARSVAACVSSTAGAARR